MKLTLAIFVEANEFFSDCCNFIWCEVEITIVANSSKLIMVFLPLHVNDPVNMEVLYGAHIDFTMLQCHLTFALFVTSYLLPNKRDQPLVNLISIM